jgi:hypothetical protein
MIDPFNVEAFDKEYQETDRTPEVLAAIAATKNCEVVYGSEWTLQIDLDSPAAIYAFENQCALLFQRREPPWTRVERWTSKSGEGEHVVLHLKEPTPILERILLQAALGSDIKRELIAWDSVKNNRDNPLVLFRPKDPVTFVAEIDLSDLVF